MQINKVGNVNFGATTDKQTRNVLKALERVGVDTTNVMQLMNDIYVDKHIISSYRNGMIVTGLYDVQGNSGELIKNIVKFNPDKMLKSPKLFIKMLTQKLENIGANRSAEQRITDKVDGSLICYSSKDTSAWSDIFCPKH